MTLKMRMIAVCLVLFVVSGCYTQIRSPLEREAARSETDMQGTVPPVVVQRFEYYHDYGRSHFHDPYDFGRAYPYHYYDSFDHSVYWLYRSRPPRWYTSQIVWNQACWVSVYHPTWRRYPPRILIPNIVYGSPIGGKDHEAEGVRKPPRPNPRQTFTEGRPSSADAIRTNSVNTRPRTQTRSEPSSGTSSKQSTPEKKKEEKEDKREEKREKRKRRGGMR